MTHKPRLEDLRLDDAIQRLLGHSTEKMTKHYLDKHQEPWIVTDTVGLSLLVSPL
ncbi:hypothetical protein [Acidithiobacillus concretivorus]|uniref:Integrase n=1 Tax=Acidithiobacillus concretivorus TaxID=3063952 RepID=A0ABS5ZND5_9PROT|nr:hypothetical protein [Acidithiobacillus concretivorus]MBU2738091.1 hypothetical protein [Acidithiobacillus concretivorus]